jgi:hypothetical protein
MTPTKARETSCASSQIAFIRDRLSSCIRLIDGTPESESEQKELAWMLGEEFHGILARLWRASR